MKGRARKPGSSGVGPPALIISATNLPRSGPWDLSFAVTCGPRSLTESVPEIRVSALAAGNFNRRLTGVLSPAAIFPASTSNPRGMPLKLKPPLTRRGPYRDCAAISAFSPSMRSTLPDGRSRKIKVALSIVRLSRRTAPMTAAPGAPSVDARPAFAVPWPNSQFRRPSASTSSSTTGSRSTIDSMTMRRENNGRN